MTKAALTTACAGFSRARREARKSTLTFRAQGADARASFPRPLAAGLCVNWRPACASIGGRLVRPMLFDGHCGSDVVESYFKDMLLPSIPKGSLIVLDNASFHHAPSTQALVEAAGCEPMFRPPYSPDLNPIEHIWAALKKRLQNGLAEAKDKVVFIGKNCLALCA